VLARNILQTNFAKFAAGFVTGVVLAVILSFLLLRPGTTKANVLPNTIDNSDEMKQSLDAITEENISFKKQLDQKNAEIIYYQNEAALLNAEKLVLQNQFQDATEILIKINLETLKDTRKKKWTELLNVAAPKAALAAYNDGYRLFNSGKYDAAVEKFEKVVLYGNDWSYMDSTLYVLGKGYAALNNKESALNTFQKLVDKYPNTQYAQWAVYRIDELK